MYEKMRNIFKEDLGLDSCKVNKMYFAHAHRLPSDNSDGPKPLIMKFAACADRKLVLSNAYKLVGTRRRILSDLHLVMKKERGKTSQSSL